VDIDKHDFMAEIVMRLSSVDTVIGRRSASRAL
jgi:hypothetical protein